MRLDTGVRAGDEIGVYYDPMLAKLIVWDQDRAGALRRLRSALERLPGGRRHDQPRACWRRSLRTLPLSRASSTPASSSATVASFFPLGPAPDPVLGIGALSELLRARAEAAAEAARSPDPHSPWHQASGWRLNDDNLHTLELGDGEREVRVIARYRADHVLLELPDRVIRASGELVPDGRLRFDFDGAKGSATVVRTGEELTVFSAFGRHRLQVRDPLHAALPEEVVSGSLVAPMPGNIISVLVQAGQRVTVGAPLMILEAMKMEHTISAPLEGVVERVNFAVGDQVAEGAELLAIAEPD